MLRKRLSQTGQFFQNFDYILFAVVIILIIFGILMIHSATNEVASLADRVRSQIRYGIIGAGVVLVMAAIDYRYLTSTYLWIYGVIVAILGVVGLLGVEGEAGAQSWVNLGVAGFQPSELAKMLLIIVLAQQLADNVEQIGKLKTILISLGFVMLPVFFIFIQPDLGISVLVMVTWFAMVWGAGMRWEHILLFVVVAIVAMPVLWPHMEPYQQSRIITFINIDADKDAAYNIEQALTAIGNGGLLGRGYMQGTQSQLRFLRVRHTDFIFAVIAEELGFVGAMLVLILMAIVVFRILRAARLAHDMAGSLLCYGVAMVIFFQTLVSIGMNIRLLPVTGLTLPFVSSGGSSLVTLMFGIGLVESVVLRHGARQP
ncbi:MAG: rod shape-determining protein RodA [Anaerolineae bacterium]|nr:rod shape-determining protein RodA [Anaerolineae bacterium]